jgi:hypothetical protein
MKPKYVIHYRFGDGTHTDNVAECFRSLQEAQAFVADQLARYGQGFCCPAFTGWASVYRRPLGPWQWLSRRLRLWWLKLQERGG